MSSAIQSSEDDLIFLDEPEQEDISASSRAQSSWRIMIIDDDPDVHSATTFALGSLEIQHRPLTFLHAYSAAEARDILQKESDIAIILLDVVMEQEDAGLQLVNYIRKTLGLADVRIILRTGQPGYAPEIDAIRDYDINDYKTKSELTRTKLYTAVTSAIRSYEQICAIDASRRGLEMIVNASTELMAQHGLKNFASGVLKQITELLNLNVPGFACGSPNHPEPVQRADDLIILAASGHFQDQVNQSLGSLHSGSALNLMRQSLNEKRNQRNRALFQQCGQTRIFGVPGIRAAFKRHRKTFAGCFLRQCLRQSRQRYPKFAPA